jgi:RNA polymerase sigma factor (sigma-70 family)
MSGDGEFGTGVTLLGRLRRDPTNQAAWNEFVDQYGRKIYRWCRHWHLHETDAEDVTQMVLLKLAEKLRTFVYDPARSFRAWLKTLTQHAWSDFVEGRQQPGRGSGDSDVQALLHTVAARDELVQQLEEQFDHELLQEAVRRVRLRVEPRTWEAFQLVAITGLSGAEAGRQLQMKVATVFVNRSHVQKMLQEEIRCLEEGA